MKEKKTINKNEHVSGNATTSKVIKIIYFKFKHFSSSTPTHFIVYYTLYYSH